LAHIDDDDPFFKQDFGPEFNSKAPNKEGPNKNQTKKTKSNKKNKYEKEEDADTVHDEESEKRAAELALLADDDNASDSDSREPKRKTIKKGNNSNKVNVWISGK